MNFTDALMTNVEALPHCDDGNGDHRAEFLDWVAGLDFLKVSVFESELEVGEKYHRFTVQGVDAAGEQSAGFGRAKDKLTAATIASSEMIERYVSRQILRNSSQFSAPFLVSIEGGGIDVKEAEAPSAFPSKGFHSSNGWAVHFSMKQAIENAAREALERHILLLSYLKHGWAGFAFDEQVPFKKAVLTPGVARMSVGGFRAGIVVTAGPEAQGVTYGYLCEEAAGFEKSRKWLAAFFESYEQWIDLIGRMEPASPSMIEQYQWHHFKGERPTLSTNPTEETQIDAATGALAVFNLQEVLSSPVPLFAAFVFGGDFIPLFLKQKLSSEEQRSLTNLLQMSEIETELPEYHPIL